jgi:hypothetical protein
MKAAKITYFVATGLLSAMMLMSAGMYFFNHQEIAKAFAALGYPLHIIYPLAVAKLLGLVAIWSGISPTLRRLAYAGFLYTFILATTAHLVAGDGAFMPAGFALILLGASYWGDRFRHQVASTATASAPTPEASSSPA